MTLRQMRGLVTGGGSSTNSAINVERKRIFELVTGPDIHLDSSPPVKRRITTSDYSRGYDHHTNRAFLT